MAGRTAILGGVALASLLAACGEREEILPGERIAVEEVLSTRAPRQPQIAPQSTSLSLPPQSSNASWAQSGVSPFARVDHAAFAASPQPLWSVDIGKGDTRRQRLNVDPVVAGGRVFTVDSENVLRATSVAGEPLWSYTLTPPRDKADQGQGGGLAVSGERLYVASGFGTLTAIDVASGAELWVQDLDNTATGAPSVADGLVYVTSGDQTGWAIEADNGRVRWQIDGRPDVANVAGAPAPALSDKLVLFSFGSGTVQAAFRQGGLRLWSADLLGGNQGVTRASIDDITGDPVISGDQVFVGTHSGRLAALSVHTGDQLWTTQHGALGPVWPAGGSIFVVNDLNQLMRLDASTGAEIWSADLPGYVERRNPNARRDSAYANLGPILAGGRLVVAGSDGLIRLFSPESGALAGTIEVPGGATTRPVVAGGVLYVVSTKGVLHAYR